MFFIEVKFTFAMRSENASMTIFLRMTTDATLRVKNGINTKTMLSLWLGTFI